MTIVITHTKKKEKESFPDLKINSEFKKGVHLGICTKLKEYSTL